MNSPRTLVIPHLPIRAPVYVFKDIRHMEKWIEAGGVRVMGVDSMWSTDAKPGKYVIEEMHQRAGGHSTGGSYDIYVKRYKSPQWSSIGYGYAYFGWAIRSHSELGHYYGLTTTV